MGQLFKILDWAKKEGDVEAINRIRVMVLPITMGEGLVLAAVDAATECSAECVKAVKKAAEEVVGSPFPA